MQREDFTTEEVAGMLRRAAGQPCPPSCRCPRHQERASVRLVAVASADGVAFTDECTGSYDCGCDCCCDQRAVLVQLGPRQTPRQPWQPVARAA